VISRKYNYIPRNIRGGNILIEIVKQHLADYQQQLYADASLANQSLLETPRKTLNDLLDKQLQAGCLETDAVHLSTEVASFFGGDKHFTVKVLSEYLTQPLALEEEYWARWELVDNLALLRRSEETVEKQQDFLAWTRKCLPSDRLLRVMSDGTQSLSWMAMSKGDEWLQIFHEIITSVAPSQDNRQERFYYLRTAGLVYTNLERFQEALQVTNKIRDLSNEDPNWEPSFGMRIESYALEIKVHGRRQDVSAIRRIGQDASLELEVYRSQHLDFNFDEKRKLSTLHHNLAAALYFARQYDLAIPLFRSAISLGMWEQWTYSWLAASLWITTKSRPEVLQLLKQASERVVGNYDAWMNLTEFQDVLTDAEFINAAKR
jgi:tetratricopeptide (TPR) repeat protein